MQGDAQIYSLTKNYNIFKEKGLKLSPLTAFCKACWAANELVRWLGLLCETLGQKSEERK